jgi:uncharacterized protein (TIGR02246 family)
MLTALGCSIMGQTDSSKDETAVRGVVQKVQDAWNSQDGKAFAAVFADDADCVGVNGMYTKGRKEIENGYAAIFTTFYKESRNNANSKRVPFLRPDQAVVHVQWNLEFTLGGTLNKGHAMNTMVVGKRSDGKWPDLQSTDDFRTKSEIPDTPVAAPGRKGFNWSGAVKQSLLFLAVQHGYAMTQPKTREALKGPFVRDYFRSVRALHGWDDGGRFFTNYVAHPMQGAFLGFIQVQNDPKGRDLRVSNTKEYWKSRAKALAWSAAWSTQFEIGPLSQASIGNVGLKGKQTYIDIVITPTVGTAWLVVEDFMDQHVSRRLERKFGGRYVRIFARMLLNPVRTMANLFRFKKPWYRDKGLR